MQFSKGQGYVDLGRPNPDAFAFEARDFSFAAWVQIGNPIPNRGVARRILSKQKTDTYGFFLRIFPDGRPGFGYNLLKPTPKTSARAAVAVRDLIAPVQVGDGAWHHLAGIHKAGRLSLFVDGKLRATALNDSLKVVDSFTDYNDNSPLLFPDTGLDGHLVVGCVKSGVDGFDGSIDDVRVYARALTPQEVLQLFRPFSSP